MMNVCEKLLTPWAKVNVPESIPHGDMPGDKICINEAHVRKAEKIFPVLKEQLAKQLQANPSGRCVMCVCGGSGVGKSEIASVLAYYLNGMGVGAYIMSGDNYPRRIPRDNDLERERVFRVGGLRGLVSSGRYDNSMADVLRALWAEGKDCDQDQVVTYPWLAIYQQAGRRCLDGYLGTPAETDFDEVNGIIAAFKQGAAKIALKRMGRDTTELWYEEKDFSATQVLIIEWTHGNSDFLQGVDIPVLLNSTPAETLAHRRARNRDGQTDSAFTMMVLELEQKKLEHQAEKARIILSKTGEILTYAEFRTLMAQA